MTTSLEARGKLVEALSLDLVGPGPGHLHESELIDQAPSRWYLAGFLVPRETKAEEKTGFEGEGEVDSAADGGGGGDDEKTPERTSGRKAMFSSSMGMSVLVPSAAKSIELTVEWGDYTPEEAGKHDGPQRANWKRKQCKVEVSLPLVKRRATKALEGFAGLSVVWTVRKVTVDDGIALPKGTRAVSLFFVNDRQPQPEQNRDEAYVFQAQLHARCAEGFVPRPNWRGLTTSDVDERTADLQYRDAYEYGVGHGVATDAVVADDACKEIHTCWIPSAEVERVVPADVKGVELRMIELAKLTTGDTAAKLGAFVSEWKLWLTEQAKVSVDHPRRKEVLTDLLAQAAFSQKRLSDGIALLSQPNVLRAFCLANKAMDLQARQRNSLRPTPDRRDPQWRPFQLAFVLINLRSIVDPAHDDREVVDLLFFPTGGGKTEAYLGLAAFTLIYRRLMNPGISSAGLAVLMRYTLRLLTLDQLQRAAALVCALELMRSEETDLGSWPFEIGLWVGKAATPNKMGRKGDNDKDSARARVIAYKNDDKKPLPIPLEVCPWCGEKFRPTAFRLMKDGAANEDHPDELRILCLNRACKFSGKPLPILAVDEPIYRRLPCFLIATVDKFAGLPWEGRSGALLGKVDRFDAGGFYGPTDAGVGKALPAKLAPPDLIIQDELHLISGPLGTMAGLYESAIEQLCCRKVGEKLIKPKVVASTATVRRAGTQIRALFARTRVEIFPPPGPNRRDSFFAKTVAPSSEDPPRLYLGVASAGRSLKVILLRTYVALLSAAQKLYLANGGKRADNPADPYMTLLGYFNSLRELGGARRIVEDEVQGKVSRYGDRRRVGEDEKATPFARRQIQYDVVELTSRESNSNVAKAKRRLELTMNEKDAVDVAIATNMISVGLDITRLGLMVVLGQPKTTAEYIQASSRVGRDARKPGLVVTLLNVHRPRDRSHYERFEAYHQSFYRSVEATSVTPFSARAIDRGLAGVVVALARHGQPELTAPRSAVEMDKLVSKTAWVAAALGRRAAFVTGDETTAKKVEDRAKSLLDDWSIIATEQRKVQAGLQYQREVGNEPPLLHTPLDPALDTLGERQKRFKANRSLRDVEPSVNLYVRSLVHQDVVVDDGEVE